MHNQFPTMGIPEKHTDDITPAPRSSGSIDAGKLENADDAFEVFKKGEGAVNFRTVGWIQASVIFLKSKLWPPITNLTPMAKIIIFSGLVPKFQNWFPRSPSESCHNSISH